MSPIDQEAEIAITDEVADETALDHDHPDTDEDRRRSPKMMMKKDKNKNFNVKISQKSVSCIEKLFVSIYTLSNFQIHKMLPKWHNLIIGLCVFGVLIVAHSHSHSHGDGGHGHTDWYIN